MSNVPLLIRAELADSIEEMGQAMGLLRESVADHELGNVNGAQICASDAVELISGLESKFADMAARLCAWTNVSVD
jgi:hypothetical protein